MERMIECAFCSGPHAWWDCRKKPEGWKPPTKSTGQSGVRANGVRATTARVQVAAPSIPQVEAATAHLAPKKRGRPKTITDMRAYKAEHERKRRAKLKEGK